MSKNNNSTPTETPTLPASRIENVDRAFREGVTTALQSHLRKGNLVPVLRGNKVVLVSPGDIVESPPRRVATLFHADLFGTFQEKSAKLAEQRLTDVPWSEIKPSGPFYLFVPQNQDMREEYEKGWSVKDIFPVNVLGFQTHRDPFAIDLDETALRDRVAALRDTKLTDDEIAVRYDLQSWGVVNIAQARKRLRADKNWEAAFTDCLYRPFDKRPCYYSDIIMDRPRKDLVQNMLGNGGPNIALNTVRQTRADTWQHAVVSDKPTPAVFVEIKDGSNVFPLYIYPTEQEKEFGIEKHANFAPAFVKDLTERIGTAATPEETFGYIYSILHSPTYRERYADFLKRDFPRIPLPPNMSIFKDLAALGNLLVALHLLESPTLSDPKIGFPDAGTNTVEKMKADKRYTAGRVRLNAAQSFTNVPSDVWEYRVGGYQPAAKWLDDRAGRILSDADITHYRRTLAALRETLALLPIVDSMFTDILGDA